MSKIEIIRVLAITNIVVGILMLLWWVLMGLGLPVDRAAQNFDALIAHGNWVPINLIGLAACLLWLLSLPSLLLVAHERSGVLGFLGIVLAAMGIALFTCIQYYETFLWPVVVRTNPGLLKVDGPLVFGSRLVAVPLLLSGAILGLGYILTGINLWRRRILPRAAVLMLTIGVVVFGNGIAFPLRTLGLLAFCAAMIWIGVAMARGAAA